MAWTHHHGTRTDPALSGGLHLAFAVGHEWLKGPQEIADEGVVPVCPICAHQLQTLDLPCPSCAAEPLSGGAPLNASVDLSEAREFSETLHYSRIVRYRPQEFVNQVNRWLLAHPGIVGISAVLHRDREGVRSMTFTCQALLDPIPLRVQVACLPLRSQLGRRLYRDPGEALSVWSDANPEARRLNHWIFAASGNASEVWILFVVPASAVQTSEGSGLPSVGPPRRRYLATLLRVLVVLLVLLIAFLILGFIVTLMAGPSAQSGSLIGSAAAVAVLWGIVFVLKRFQRMPLRRRGRDRKR